ncbi:putative beta-mannosidase [Rhizodiscina lignyota]|uniref:Beta-mannosidase A n=1 Tax=Rhizodiscina lignyota TaxID=1504668 RepID=A0A9P4M6K3_9PEZI|nr:putative beta-mannosidase [Rhizodiscina lignyota]
MKNFIAPVFVALSLLQPISSYSVYDLSNVQWTLSDPGNNVSVPGSLPSQAHLDLFKAGVIPDPYLGLGDFTLRWVLYSNWTWSGKLPSSCYSDGGQNWLVFNGLDTFSSISLCGKHVAATNNQFRQYYFDVSDILSSCNSSSPELKINFGSAVKIANEIAAQPGQETWPYPVEQVFEFPNRWFVRKEQSDFGWDWGPAFVPAGPWQPAYVASLKSNDVYVRNTLVDIYRKGQLPLVPPDQSQPWVVNVSLDYLGDLPNGTKLKYKLTDLSNKTIASGSLSNVTSSKGVIGGTTIVEDGAVDLWWPVGMGDQTLYYLQVDIVGTSNSASVTKRVGFRTIVSNQFPITDEQLAEGIAPGANWHFEINGMTFYAKGSNWIPPDAFWPRVTPARIQQLFDSVVLGNQNMLRVWASGAYSPDFMYDLADEYGILLWSEFEFGDALYPVDEAFLANVADEVYYQVRRINHHPSLCYWAGGNELENLELSEIAQYAPDQLARYQGEYEKLFLDTIVPILFGNSHSISYSPSSTSNGWLSLDFNKSQPITERYNNKTNGSIYGETDFYNYDSSQSFNLSAYPVGRFSNEFGFHSMPSLQSWQDVLEPSDWHFNSSTVVLRNHHYPPGGPFTDNFANASKGMGEMTIAVERWYPAPDKTDSVANFSAWCHATQIFQADLYKSEIQFYRRGSGLPERQLGSLWWQLEDIWQAPTWAAVEYSGRWKVLQYIGKDIYQHVIIAPYYNVTTGDLEVYVTSDLWTPAKGSATFTWYDWSGKKLNVSTASSVDFTVGAINTTRVLHTNVNESLANFDMANAVLKMSVSATGSPPNSNASQTFTHENWFHASPLSSAKLVDPGLKYSWDSNGSSLTVEATKGVAAWTWIDYPHGAILAFDQNGFWLGKGEKKTVNVMKLWSDTTSGAWTKNVTVESLWDQTQS